MAKMTREVLVAMGCSEEQIVGLLALAPPAAKEKPLTLKVQREPRIDPLTKEVKPPTGTVSCYNLNIKFPVSLYKSQWIRLLDNADKIRAFLNDPAEQHGMAQEKADK
jgi:hypothetical protein